MGGAGDRMSAGTFTIEVGGLTDNSGERSFTVSTKEVENLPIANRSFTALASLAPGVTTTGDPARIGGGGDTNIMMNGVGVMDTGSNRPLLQMNVEVRPANAGFGLASSNGMFTEPASEGSCPQGSSPRSGRG